MPNFKKHTGFKLKPKMVHKKPKLLKKIADVIGKHGGLGKARKKASSTYHKGGARENRSNTTLEPKQFQKSKWIMEDWDIYKKK
tara:strand:+ start:471 stop:722 length:252 start_codon:yes stop_codon:yes gene_type:complete